MNLFGQKHPELKKENPQTSGDVFKLEMLYDLKTNNFQLKAPGIPTVMLYGIIQMGLSMCIQKQVENQVLMNLREASQKIRVAGADELPKGGQA